MWLLRTQNSIRTRVEFTSSLDNVCWDYVAIVTADLQPIEICVQRWCWWHHWFNKNRPILPSLTDCLSGGRTAINSGRDKKKSKQINDSQRSRFVLSHFCRWEYICFQLLNMLCHEGEPLRYFGTHMHEHYQSEMWYIFRFTNAYFEGIFWAPFPDGPQENNSFENVAFINALSSTELMYITKYPIHTCSHRMSPIPWMVWFSPDIFFLTRRALEQGI